MPFLKFLIIGLYETWFEMGNKISENSTSLLLENNIMLFVFREFSSELATLSYFHFAKMILTYVLIVTLICFLFY